MVRNNEIICVVLYHDYAAQGIECSIVASNPRWRQEGTLAHLFGYPFMYLGCNRITVRVLKDNLASNKLMKKLGFVEEGLIREAVNGVDQYIYGMLRKECPHIGKYNVRHYGNSGEECIRKAEGN